MPDLSGRELLSEWRTLIDSVLASATSTAGGAVPRPLLEAMQRQLDLVQDVIERERRMQKQLAAGVSFAGRRSVRPARADWGDAAPPSRSARDSGTGVGGDRPARSESGGAVRADARCATRTGRDRQDRGGARAQGAYARDSTAPR